MGRQALENEALAYTKRSFSQTHLFRYMGVLDRIKPRRVLRAFKIVSKRLRVASVLESRRPSRGLRVF